eukprot:g28387.t1
MQYLGKAELAVRRKCRTGIESNRVYNHTVNLASLELLLIATWSSKYHGSAYWLHGFRRSIRTPSSSSTATAAYPPSPRRPRPAASKYCMSPDPYASTPVLLQRHACRSYFGTLGTPLRLSAVGYLASPGPKSIFRAAFV